MGRNIKVRVLNGRLSETVQVRLEKPFIPAPDYADLFIANADKYVD